jgi:hypothetical protein
MLSGTCVIGRARRGIYNMIFPWPYVPLEKRFSNIGVKKNHLENFTVDTWIPPVRL